MVNIEEVSIAAAAVEFGVGWHTANDAVTEHTDPAVDDPARLDGVAGIGVDEKRFLNATADHRTIFTTQIVDLDRHRLLEVIEGRSGDVLDGWLAERGADWCEQITLATLDPAAGYRAALLEHLPNATLVVDHFHAIKLANTAIDDIRRRVQQATLGHRGRKGDPLYRARRVFLTGFERLSDERIAWMFEMLAAGDPHGELGAAIMAKELLREVYRAVDVAHARRRLTVFFQHCADADVPELTRLARTIDRWRDEILAYHTCGRASNGRVENLHMHAEKAPPQRPGLHQPQQLPAPPHRTPRHQMDYHPNPQNPRPSTTLHRVEPPIQRRRRRSSVSLSQRRRRHGDDDPSVDVRS